LRLLRRVTRDELNGLVDKAADLIRTAVDYKFILVLLFLKRLNDLWSARAVQTLQMQEKDRKSEN
jgi:type I restriction enzyme M protein